MADTEPTISLVIPTYNESKSIVQLVTEVAQTFNGSGVHVEYIVVDDNSPDGTAQKAETLKVTHDLKVIVRKNERGLATAVVHGWKASRGRLLAVIDGDLQHPPDIIRRLYAALMEFDAELAVASRKASGGGTENWEFKRVVISEVATKIAKFFLPVSLFKIQDATTGCFMFKKELVDLSSLSPHGFKIFLEVLVRGNFSKPVEVPYIFSQRSLGVSKMTMKQNFLFLYHLVKLGLVTGEIAIPILIVLAFIVLLTFILPFFA